jgi:3-hydroxyisobutyrate dehydrogenase-like beta-hydroxyacid dehydrogenase
MSSPPPASVSDAAIDLSMSVGFVGVGHMGFPLVQRLIRAQVPVLLWNRTQAKVEPLVAEGAHWARTPKDLARSVGKGVTFLMLTDGAAVKRVLFGRSGLGSGAPPGALVVNMSTIDPDESRTFAARLGERGVHYVDAPVAGSVEQVTRGEAFFLVGGEDPDFTRARPLLERMGARVEHMGPVGAGNSAKLVNNLLTVGITALSTEALALADGFHLDRARILEVLLAGGGRSVMLERKGPAFVARQYPAQFSTALARKDLKLVEKAAAREGRPLKMTREARKLLDEAIAQGHSEDDFSSVFEATLHRGRSQAPKPAEAEPSVAPAEAPAPGNPPS